MGYPLANAAMVKKAVARRGGRERVIHAWLYIILEWPSYGWYTAQKAMQALELRNVLTSYGLDRSLRCQMMIEFSAGSG